MISELVEILKSSGPVSLDELNLRSSDGPEELVTKIDDLKRRGVVYVTGPHSESLSSLEAADIETDSTTMVSLTRSAFKSGR